MGFDFYKFRGTCTKSEKQSIYLSIYLFIYLSIYIYTLYIYIYIYIYITWSCSQFTAIRSNREMNGETENGHFTELPLYMPHHTITCHTTLLTITFHRTTTPHDAINQADNYCCWRGCFDLNSGTTTICPNFWSNS